jgi:iron(III) transport system permease protein
LQLNTSFWVLIGALVIGLTYRFLILSYNFIGFESSKIDVSLEQTALIMKKSKKDYLKHVWLPLVSPALKFALIFTSLEVIKEMPLTLLLRPTGVDTLATKIYEFTSEGEWERAAIPSLAIVFLSLIITTTFHKRLTRA